MATEKLTRQWMELCDQANQAEARYAFERTLQNLRLLRRVQKQRDEIGRRLRSPWFI